MKPKMKIDTGKYMKAGDVYFFEDDYVKVIMENNEVHYGTIVVMGDDYFYLRPDQYDKLTTTILMPLIHSIYKTRRPAK